MNLDYNQLRKAHNFFKQLHISDPTRLEELGIEKCEACDGTGLGGIVKLQQGGYSWANTTDFCDKCHGVGFNGLRNLKTFDDEKFICGKCNGVGCGECKDGFVDWITHAMGR